MFTHDTFSYSCDGDICGKNHDVMLTEPKFSTHSLNKGTFENKKISGNLIFGVILSRKRLPPLCGKIEHYVFTKIYKERTRNFRCFSPLLIHFQHLSCFLILNLIWPIIVYILSDMFIFMKNILKVN